MFNMSWMSTWLAFDLKNNDFSNPILFLTWDIVFMCENSLSLIGPSISKVQVLVCGTSCEFLLWWTPKCKVCSDHDRLWAHTSSQLLAKCFLLRPSLALITHILRTVSAVITGSDPLQVLGTILASAEGIYRALTSVDSVSCHTVLIAWPYILPCFRCLFVLIIRTNLKKKWWSCEVMDALVNNIVEIILHWKKIVQKEQSPFLSWFWFSWLIA